MDRGALSEQAREFSRLYSQLNDQIAALNSNNGDDNKSIIAELRACQISLSRITAVTNRMFEAVLNERIERESKNPLLSKYAPG